MAITSSKLHNDFRAAVQGGWDQVHPSVRARMDDVLTAPQGTLFEGEGYVRRSAVGWLYAQAARLFGAPLVWRQGERVKITFRVAPTLNDLRCWHRTYTFQDGARRRVETTKMLSHGVV